MEQIQEKILIILFGTLIGFILINAIVSFAVLKINDRSIFKQLVGYWTTLFFVFILQGITQKSGYLEISLAHGMSAIPMTFLANFLFNAFNEKFPLKIYAVLYTLGIPATYLANALSSSFTAIAAPYCILVSLPLLHATYIALIKNRTDERVFPKLLGILFLLMPIHIMNFALFRMVEGTQLWGWVISFSIYQCVSSILPQFILEEITKNEKTLFENTFSEYKKKINDLEQQVANKTKQLATLKEKMTSSSIKKKVF